MTLGESGFITEWYEKYRSRSKCSPSSKEAMGQAITLDDLYIVLILFLGGGIAIATVILIFEHVSRKLRIYSSRWNKDKFQDRDVMAIVNTDVGLVVCTDTGEITSSVKRGLGMTRKFYLAMLYLLLLAACYLFIPLYYYY